MLLLWSLDLQVVRYWTTYSELQFFLFQNKLILLEKYLAVYLLKVNNTNAYCTSKRLTCRSFKAYSQKVLFKENVFFTEPSKIHLFST